MEALNIGVLGRDMFKNFGRERKREAICRGLDTSLLRDLFSWGQFPGHKNE